MDNMQDRFCAGTLKRKRIANFKLDVQRFSTIFLSLQQHPHDITMKDFRRIWVESEMIYIHWCRITDEEPQEYYQALYQLFSNKFYQSQAGKVFALFSLYFLYFGSEDKIRINVDCQFVDGIRDLLLIDRVRKNLDICFICRKLYSNFVYASRRGIRTILVRANGEPIVKQRLPELQVESYLSLDKVLCSEQLKKVNTEYEKKKNKQAENDYGLRLRETDKHFCDRVQELLQNFKKSWE